MTAPASSNPSRTGKAASSALSRSAHVDSFARDNLPPREQWPELLLDRPELRYPERLNAAEELLDSLKPASPKAAPPATPRGVALLVPYGARLSGMEDVDLEIHFHAPDKLSLALEPAKLRTATGNWMGSIEPVENSQTAVVAKVRGPGRVAAVLFPRLKSEAMPKVDWSVDGSVVQVRTAETVDYVCLAPPATSMAKAEAKQGPLANTPNTRPPMASPDGVVAFQGTAGHVRIRQGQATMTLGAAGLVRVFGEEWRSEKPASRTITVGR